MKRTIIRITLPLVYFALGVALVYFGLPSRIVVTWETVSEVDTAGFALYRGESPDGPFLPITETPIPAEGDPLVGASYQYEDRDLVWGQRYFYRLEEVERSGSRNPSSEVIEGRAGAGWLWALIAGGLLAALGVVVAWYITRPDRGQSAGSSERSHPAL